MQYVAVPLEDTKTSAFTGNITKSIKTHLIFYLTRSKLVPILYWKLTKTILS